jgi:hypothetical protein
MNSEGLLRRTDRAEGALDALRIAVVEMQREVVALRNQVAVMGQVMSNDSMMVAEVQRRLQKQHN